MVSYFEDKVDETGKGSPQKSNVTFAGIKVENLISPKLYDKTQRYLILKLLLEYYIFWLSGTFEGVKTHPCPKCPTPGI